MNFKFTNKELSFSIRKVDGSVAFDGEQSSLGLTYEELDFIYRVCKRCLENNIAEVHREQIDQLLYKKFGITVTDNDIFSSNDIKAYIIDNNEQNNNNPTLVIIDKGLKYLHFNSFYDLYNTIDKFSDLGSMLLELSSKAK